MKTCTHTVYLLLLVSIASTHASEIRFNIQNNKGARMVDVAIALIPKEPISVPVNSAAIIDQVNKEFTPRVSVVQKGSLVRFPNSDNIRHHVYSFSEANRFELKLYSGEPSKPISFDNEGIVVLGCNIHDWMVAYVVVVNSPYHIVQQANSETKLNVPAGEYQLVLWHPILGAPITEHLLVESAALNIQRQLPVNEP